MLVTNNFLQAGLLNPDRKTATLRYITPDTSVASAKSVIIDIDLDYFYCDYETGETFDVQITEQEYSAFCENPYHRLRMTSGGKLRAEERADGFYYVYQPGMIRETPEFSRKAVKQRISQFAAWLQEHAIEPALIDICRSRHSGYTPADQWSWIEEHLLEALKQNFVITVKNFDEVLKEQGVTEEFQCPRPGR